MAQIKQQDRDGNDAALGFEVTPLFAAKERGVETGTAGEDQ